MKNNYGNFVVQKALKIVKEENKVILLKAISKNVERIGDKKIIDKWKTIIISALNGNSGSSQMSIYPMSQQINPNFQMNNNPYFMQGSGPGPGQGQINQNYQFNNQNIPEEFYFNQNLQKSKSFNNSSNNYKNNKVKDQSNNILNFNDVSYSKSFVNNDYRY